MGSLFQITFTSTAIRDFSRRELLKLLDDILARNRRAGITGLLLYKDGRFMQVLEGEETDVIRLFARISHDPRHRQVVPLLHQPIGQRCFPDWKMAFPDEATPELKNRPGYSDFLNTPVKEEMLAVDVPECQKLLLDFKRNVQGKPQRENCIQPQLALAALLLTLSANRLFCELAEQRENFEALLRGG